MPAIRHQLGSILAGKLLVARQATQIGQPGNAAQHLGGVDDIGEVFEQHHSSQAKHQAGDRGGQHIALGVGRDWHQIGHRRLNRGDLVDIAGLSRLEQIAIGALGSRQLSTALVEPNDQAALRGSLGGLLDLVGQLVDLGLGRADRLLQACDLSFGLLAACYLLAARAALGSW